MRPELHKFISGFLDRHKTLTVATNRADGWPQATTMNYVNEGLVLYSFISRVSQKHTNIRRDGRVSITLAREFSMPQEIQGLPKFAIANRPRKIAQKDSAERKADERQ